MGAKLIKIGKQWRKKVVSVLVFLCLIFLTSKSTPWIRQIYHMLPPEIPYVGVKSRCQTLSVMVCMCMYVVAYSIKWVNDKVASWKVTGQLKKIEVLLDLLMNSIIQGTFFYLCSNFFFKKTLFEFPSKVQFEFISVYWDNFITLSTFQSSRIEVKFRKLGMVTFQISLKLSVICQLRRRDRWKKR